MNCWFVAHLGSFFDGTVLARTFSKKKSPVLLMLFPPAWIFQGRTALWDAILLLCHQINVGYSGVVRGIHIGSSALNILSVLDSDMES